MSSAVEQMLYGIWCHSTLRTNISYVGTTVFCGMQNFEPSRGICPFPWTSYTFAEFILLQNLVVAGDKSTNMPYFVQFQAAIDK